MKTILSSLIVLLIAAQGLFGLGQPVKESDELVGLWKRKIFNTYKMKRLSSYEMYDWKVQPYQYFYFREDGYLRLILASRELTLEQLKMFMDAPNCRMTWKMISSGVVSIEHLDNPSQSMNWLLSEFDKEERYGPVVMKPGQICMGLLGQDRTYISLRVLERVPGFEQ